MTTPTLWRFTAGEMRRRPGRTLLTLFGIVIGVAAVFAITLTTGSTHRAYRDMFEAVAGRAALEVVAEGAGGFDEALASELQAVAGVKAAVPVVQIASVVLGEKGRVPVLVLGIDPELDKAARDLVPREGRLFAASGGREPLEEALLPATFADALQVRLGQPIRLLTPLPALGGPITTNVTVVGLLEPRGFAAFNGGSIVFLPLGKAQQLFNLRGRINSLQIVLAEGADPRKVESEVRLRLPAGLTVQAPAARGQLAQDHLQSVELSLSSLSLVSLVAGAFVILNAFLMSLGERRRQLALLRALGATRGQVTRLLLREAVLLGVVGTLLGLAAGWGLAVALRRMLEQVMAITFPEPRLSPMPFLLALVLGPGMSLVSTVLPARRAGRRAPLDDLLRPREEASATPRRWPCYLGLVLMSAVILFVIGLLGDWFSGEMAAQLLPIVTGLSVIGVVLALPLLLSPLQIAVARLLDPLLGLEGRLAFRQLARHPGRTALTAGVLLMGVIISIGFGQSMRNSIRDIHKWSDATLWRDFYIRANQPDTTVTITVAPMAEALADRLAALEGVARVDKINFLPARVQERSVVVVAFTIGSDEPVPFALTGGRADDVRQGWNEGQAVLANVLARRLGVHVGDTITVETARGPQAIRVVGTATEYTVGGMAVFLDWNRANQLFDLPGVHAFGITAQPGQAANVEPRLRELCAKHGLWCQSNAELRAFLDQAVDAVAGFFWMLVVLVFVVASLGMVNTLTMNVLEQTRELGVLRAVAMQRRQVRKLVLSQALLLAVISLAPGVVFGIFMAYLMNLATEPTIGQAIEFHVDALFVAGCLAVALMVALLAAAWPARRAARLRIIEALQYE
jgi:putative ABC transport system permease protein